MLKKLSCVVKTALVARPVISLGHQKGRRVFRQGPKFFELCPIFIKLCPTHFSRRGKNFIGENFSAPPLVTGLLVAPQEDIFPRFDVYFESFFL